MAIKYKLPGFVKMVRDIQRKQSQFAATEATNFFKRSFSSGGFTDVSFIAWNKPSNPLAGYRTLYKSGDLQRSIRKQSETHKRVIVESDLAYSEIHNNGGFITVTEQMKKFFWAKYLEFTGGRTYNTKTRNVANTKRNRTLNDKAEFCKAMALMKVGSKIKIPQRQFMGESKTLMDKFESWFSREVEIVFKNNLNNK